MEVWWLARTATNSDSAQGNGKDHMQRVAEMSEMKQRLFVVVGTAITSKSAAFQGREGRSADGRVVRAGKRSLRIDKALV